MSRKIFFLILGALVILFFRYLLFFLHAPKLNGGQRISFKSVILSEPNLYRGYSTVTVFYQNLFGGQRLTLIYSPETVLSYGDKAEISGRVEKRVTKNGSIFYSIYHPKIEVQKDKAGIFLSLGTLFPPKDKIALL